jgi:hypothetical protein
MTREEAALFLKEYVAQTSSQIGQIHGAKTRSCAECDEEVGRHGGWGRCQLHYKKRRRHAIKAACVELLGGKCVKCGGSFPPAALDFHHKEDKTFGIGNYAKSCSLERVAEEVLKCVLLCANCHRLEHASDHI